MQEQAWQALGLQRDPFPEDGPDDIFLQTPALGQRLSLFTQLAQASDLTLLLIGEHGIGKTTFLDRVAAKLDDGWRIVHWHAGRGARPADLKQALQTGLSIVPGDTDGTAHADGEADDMLAAHLEGLHSSGYRALLIVDDAHALDDETLLAALELGRQLRVALAGQPSLAERVATLGEGASSSDAGLVHRIVLGELNLPQTTDYLRTRMTRSGHNEATPFTTDVCAQLYQRSRGIPGELNRLAGEFLESEGVIEDSDGEIELDPPRHDPAAVKARLTTHAPIQPRISLHSDPKRRVVQRAAPFIALGVLVVALGAAIYGVVAWWLSDGDAGDNPEQVEVTPSESGSDPDDRYPELPKAPPPPPPSVLADQSAPLVSELPDAGTAQTEAAEGESAADAPTEQESLATASEDTPSDNTASEDAGSSEARAAAAALQLAPISGDAESDDGTRAADGGPRPRPPPRTAGAPR